MREIRTSGSTRGSGRKALLRKCRLSLSTLRFKNISDLTHESRFNQSTALPVGGRDSLKELPAQAYFHLIAEVTIVRSHPAHAGCYEE